ncbi:MAG: hypothetical protein R3B09_34700 [Nannocystaceae bacterium]
MLSTFLLIGAVGPGETAGSATADPAAGAPEASDGAVRGDRKQREEQAFRLYQAGRFAEAALEFEALWRDFAEVRYLYNAASSRFTVGHYAHATDYLTRYLGTAGLSASDRSDAAGQLAEAKRHLVSVQLRVEGPPSLAGATLTVEHVADLASDLRPPLRVSPTLTQDAWTAAIGLDPGTWEAHLEVPGYAPVHTEFAVQSGQKIDVVLRPERSARAPASEWRRPFALGFGIGGAVVAAAGIGITAGESARSGQLVDGTKCSGNAAGCVDTLSSTLNGRAWGAGLLGLGVGAAIGGATAVMPNDRRRRLFWITEASTGTVLTLVGIVSLAVGSKTANGLVPPGDPDLAQWSSLYTADGRRGATIHTTGGALLGLGVGLAGSALTGLLLTRHAAGATKKVSVSPTLGGLVLSGHF